MRYAMPRVKIQAMVMFLIAGLSFLFIFVFTSIQLRNHLDRLREFNENRARVASIIFNTSIDLLLKEARDPAILESALQVTIETFSTAGIVEKATILTRDGRVIATNDPIVREYSDIRREVLAYLNAAKESPGGSFFYSTVNNKTKVMDIYVPAYTSSRFAYILKLSFSILNIQRALKDILAPVIVTALAVIAGNLLLGYILLKLIVRPINILNDATKDLAAGHLDMKVDIRTNNEIQELGETFNLMTREMKKMKKRAEDANPLTKLPGNNLIREEIEKRIQSGGKFVAIHVDLNHFKAYNDRYGISQGDAVISFTSEILGSALKAKGNLSDFLGHQGGDDFFMITTIDKMDPVTDMVIAEFDSGVRRFYSAQDLKTGYIIEKDRSGEMKKFPLVSISMGGVTNEHTPISSYGELTNVAVGIKQRVKAEDKSIFMLDRRRA